MNAQDFLNFDNLSRHKISMNDFVIGWRFTNPSYFKFEEEQLNRMTALDPSMAKMIHDLAARSALITGLLDSPASINSNLENDETILQWLMARGIEPETQVILSWDERAAMLLPFEMLCHHYHRIVYPVSDVLLVFDHKMQWMLLFHHEGTIHYNSEK